MQTMPSRPTQSTQATRRSEEPDYTMRWRFRGDNAMSTYVETLERLRERGWRELKRWGGPEDFVVLFGGNTEPDWADTIQAKGSLH
jgi:hypothetical protein